MSKQQLLVGLTVGIWVAIYVSLQALVSGLFGVHGVEIWPVLMAPGLVGMLGGGREGMLRYYRMGTSGILAGFLFVTAEHVLYPVIGTLGELIPLALIIALIVCLQKKLPGWLGPVTFVTFNAATILTDGIFLLTITRLVVLLVGGTVFLLVETKLVGAIMSGSKQPAATAE